MISFCENGAARLKNSSKKNLLKKTAHFLHYNLNIAQHKSKHNITHNNFSKKISHQHAQLI